MLPTGLCRLDETHTLFNEKVVFGGRYPSATDDDVEVAVAIVVVAVVAAAAAAAAAAIVTLIARPATTFSLMCLPVIGLALGVAIICNLALRTLAH